MGDLLKQLLKQLLANKWGLGAVLAAAAGLVVSGVVAHDSAEGQGAGVAALALVSVGIAVLVKKIAEAKAKPPEEPKA